jgi:hypothetical protein
VKVSQLAASGTFEWHLAPRWTLGFSAGALFGGSLEASSGTYALGAGGVGSASVSWLIVEEKGFVPFVMASFGLSASLTRAQPTHYAGLDGRLGVAAGYTFFERLTPYVTARAFGGPAIWRGQTGTDLYHSQLGAGLVLGLPAGFDLSAEVVPLGEQRFSVGVGRSF